MNVAGNGGMAGNTDCLLRMVDRALVHTHTHTRTDYILHTEGANGV